MMARVIIVCSLTVGLLFTTLLLVNCQKVVVITESEVDAATEAEYSLTIDIKPMKK